MDGSVQNQIVTAVQPVFLAPLVDQLNGFVQVSALAMLHNNFTSYGAIEKIDLEENTLQMMEPYDTAKTLALLNND